MTSGKNSLAYDFQKSFRFLADLSAISLVESGVMETKDFLRTENYNLGLKPAGSREIVNKFFNMLNKRVSYQRKESTWNYVIFLKVRGLAHYLTSKKEKLDFVKLEYEIERIDSYDIKQKVHVNF
ncbi:CRISPR-associated endonuclease Cas1 [Methanosarcina sp.]|uniref:CRISPR-associated endonuclease Cas1 n=1 Tax=Methanosarcina sp. TaxID=2213 RepID=UPI002AB80DE6|nr:CRISPR-associated endonuclease Cas1 [Methanosarcina sp.]MDY9926079.1 CRISPR-associated endonuclease Cas1 [Methanosarcina sp.]